MITEMFEVAWAWGVDEFGDGGHGGGTGGYDANYDEPQSKEKRVHCLSSRLRAGPDHNRLQTRTHPEMSMKLKRFHFLGKFNVGQLEHRQNGMSLPQLRLE
ncbi:hypothetical protein B0H13DRAFT_1854392 [Mycena leptocephala]|nr:hypothetical protein B0H13DRAFT_1854392 [Mycena leptocephala]